MGLLRGGRAEPKTDHRTNHWTDYWTDAGREAWSPQAPIRAPAPAPSRTLASHAWTATAPRPSHTRWLPGSCLVLSASLTQRIRDFSAWASRGCPLRWEEGLCFPCAGSSGAPLREKKGAPPCLLGASKEPRFIYPPLDF